MTVGGMFIPDTPPPGTAPRQRARPSAGATAGVFFIPPPPPPECAAFRPLRCEYGCTPTLIDGEQQHGPYCLYWQREGLTETPF